MKKLPLGENAFFCKGQYLLSWDDPVIKNDHRLHVPVAVLLFRKK